MKRLVNTLSILGLAVVMATPVFASAMGLNINNQEVKTTQAPVIIDGTTLIPLKPIGDSLGATVDWNAKEKQVTITKGEDIIVLTIGSKQATVNGQSKELQQPAQTINGTTMLPVRFIAENLNCQVQHDKGSNTVFVTSDGVVAEIPDTSGWKTTTIKNPKIINGVPYLTKIQMEQAFDVKISSEKSDASTIERQDTHMWIYDKAWQTKSYNRINWTYVPNKPNNYIVRDGSTTYYPVQYLAPYFNSTVDYNTTTKELKVTYKGIKIHETVDTQFNDVNGYVYLPDGSPAVGFTVKGYYVAWNKGDPLLTKTDANGRYEFKGIDTEKYPIFSVGVTGEDHTNPSYRIYGSGESKVLTDKTQAPISDFDKAKCYSNLKQIPDIHLVDESIWDKK